MSWFNYPPDPEPTRPKYYRDQKQTAKRIDPGVALALRGEKIEFEIHPTVVNAVSEHASLLFGPGSHCTVSRLSTAGGQGDNPRSPDDPFASWIFIEH